MHEIRFCEFCGDIFEPRTGPGRPRRFCGATCRQRGHRGQARTPAQVARLRDAFASDDLPDLTEPDDAAHYAAA